MYTLTTISHSLPNPRALYTDDTHLTFHPNFVDIIRNHSIDMITDSICTATGTPVDEINIQVKQRLASSILTWHNGMDNTPLQKVSDIEYAFETAAKKNHMRTSVYQHRSSSLST